MVRSVARNLTMEASQKQPICKPGRRKRRSKNEPVLMVYRVPYSPLFIALYYVPVKCYNKVVTEVANKI